MKHFGHPHPSQAHDDSDTVMGPKRELVTFIVDSIGESDDSDIAATLTDADIFALRESDINELVDKMKPLHRGRVLREWAASSSAATHSTSPSPSPAPYLASPAASALASPQRPMSPMTLSSPKSKAVLAGGLAASTGTHTCWLVFSYTVNLAQDARCMGGIVGNTKRVTFVCPVSVDSDDTFSQVTR